jgi:DNA-binding response OmpR family regulator
MRPWNTFVLETHLILSLRTRELPGAMNGLELAQLLRTDFPHLKLLMTAGRLPEHEAAHIRRFIPEPYDAAEVLARIRARIRTQMKAAGLPPAERPTLLMVESDVLVRQPIAEYLRECGYVVLETANTDEAVIIIKETTTVDIVLADAQAPGKLDGFGLAKWIRVSHRRIKVILSGTVAKQAKEAGDLCEEGPHLMKPYHPQHLADRIKRALAERDRANKF